MQTKKRAKPVKFDAKEKKETRDEPIVDENIPTEKDNSDDNLPTRKEENDGKPDDENKEHPLKKTAEADHTSKDETVGAKESTDTEQKNEIEENPENKVDVEDESVEQAVVDEDLQEEEKESPIEKDSAFFNVPPGEYDKKKSSLSYFLRITLATFLLGIVFFAGIYYAVSNRGESESKESGQTASVTESPTPTEKPVNLAEYNISVLNGTSVSGVAAKVRTELTAAGFKVLSIGNATGDDFDKTEVAAKSNVSKAYLEKLKEIVQKSYVLGATSTISSGEADVVITVGSESAR